MGGIGAAKGAVEGSKEFVGRVADSMDYQQYWVPAPAVSGKASNWPVRFSNPAAFAPDSDGLIAKMKYYIDTFCEDGEIAPGVRLGDDQGVAGQHVPLRHHAPA